MFSNKSKHGTVNKDKYVLRNEMEVTRKVVRLNIGAASAMWLPFTFFHCLGNRFCPDITSLIIAIEYVCLIVQKLHMFFGSEIVMENKFSIKFLL